MLATSEASRHLQGLRTLLDTKLPGKTFAEAVISATLACPVQLDVLSLEDLRDSVSLDDRTHGARRIELPINASGDVSLSSDGLTWMQVFLPEGDTTVGVIIKTKLQGDGFYTSSLDKRTSRLCRSVAVDQAGRKLAKRWDEVDEILHHLNFRRADEWYSSGPGSIDQLNRRVEAIMMELRML